MHVRRKHYTRRESFYSFMSQYHCTSPPATFCGDNHNVNPIQPKVTCVLFKASLAIPRNWLDVSSQTEASMVITCKPVCPVVY